MRKSTIAILVIAPLSCLGFCLFGESIWRPLVARLRGLKTQDQVLSEIEPQVLQRAAYLRSVDKYDQFCLLAIKNQREMHVYGSKEGRYTYLRTYPFTGYSGTLGPKLKEGDGQIPEGIYRIVGLNPNSRFHLSLELDYPNAFDQEMAQRDGRTGLGNQIFIHGKEATIGCIPLGDEAIEEVFYMVAKSGPGAFQVIISPIDFRTQVVNDHPTPWIRELYAKIAGAMLRMRTPSEPGGVGAHAP